MTALRELGHYTFIDLVGVGITSIAVWEMARSISRWIRERNNR